MNPITEVCWDCLFPITMGGVKVSPGESHDAQVNQRLCACPKPDNPIPMPGIPISFWEPVRLVEITRTPYCLVAMGGNTLGHSKTHGDVQFDVSGTQSSFYHMHWWAYPVLYWLKLLTDFDCIEQTNLDLVYLTELDPLWNDEETSFILNAEAVLFANPIAQAACAADCIAATSGFPLSWLFWCGGCQGSLYPFTGNVSAHTGGVQASLLLTQRLIAKLHRQGLLGGTTGKRALCGHYPKLMIPKGQYKTQMVYPKAVQACYPLGRSEALWGSGKEYPYQGEDFGYLIWRKRDCCLN